MGVDLCSYWQTVELIKRFDCQVPDFLSNTNTHNHEGSNCSCGGSRCLRLSSTFKYNHSCNCHNHKSSKYNHSCKGHNYPSTTIKYNHSCKGHNYTSTCYHIWSFITG